MNSTWNDGEPIATSTNTAINIKMSSSPLLFTKLHSWLHPHFRLEGFSKHLVIYCSLFLSTTRCLYRKNEFSGFLQVVLYYCDTRSFPVPVARIIRLPTQMSKRILYQAITLRYQTIPLKIQHHEYNIFNWVINDAINCVTLSSSLQYSSI